MDAEIRQEVVPGAATQHGRGAKHCLRGGWELRDPHGQCVSHRYGDASAWFAGVNGEKLLDEEGITIRPLEDGG